MTSPTQLQRGLQDLNLTDSHPGARCGHTLTHVKDAHSSSVANGKIVLFGGTALRKPSSSLNASSNGTSGSGAGEGLREERVADTHALSLYDGHWRRVTLPAGSPPAPVGRTGHAAVAIGGALLIHGGLSCDGTVLGDLHMLRLSRLGGSGHWERIGTARTGGTPCARYGHGLAFVGDRYLVLSGGHSGRSGLGDTWLLDAGPGGCYLGLGAADVTAPLASAGDQAAALEAARRRAAEHASGVRESGCEWRQLLHGGCPSPRSFAAVAASGDAVYICGGVSAEKTALRDAFCLEADPAAAGAGAWRWRRLPDVPRARIHAAAVVAGGRVHIAGGWVGERQLPAPQHSMLVLEESDGTWDEAAIAGAGAGALCAARLALAACDHVLFTHGGMAASPPLLGETFAFSVDPTRHASLHSHPLSLRAAPSSAGSHLPSRTGSPSASRSTAKAGTTEAAPSSGRDHDTEHARFAQHTPTQPAPSHHNPTAPATPHPSLPVSTVPCGTIYVSPYHEISPDAQETAILETGLLSVSHTPDADVLSAMPTPPSASAKSSPGPPPFPPPAAAAAATPDGAPNAESRNPSVTVSANGDLKRSTSLSRSLMWTPLPNFARQDSPEKRSGYEPPPAAAVPTAAPAATPAAAAPNPLHPYSATVFVEQPGPTGAAPPAQHSAAQQRPMSWQKLEPPMFDGTPPPRRGAAAASAGNDAEPGRRRPVSGGGVPAAAAPAERIAVTRVARQLDGLHGSRLFKKYSVSKSDERHVGHRAVIEFAASCSRQVAIKFYAPNALDCCGGSLFAAEARALRDPALAPLLPPALAVHDNSSGEWRDARGGALPPAVVLARGKPLKEHIDALWARRGSRADSGDLHAALACAARCLRDFHAAGLVHRDVRSEHFLWFPDAADSGPPAGDRCALVDLACALPPGTEVALDNITLTYAAPEIVQAHSRGAQRITVSRQHDEWALGVLIFSALIGHPPFDLFGHSEKKVEEQLLGVNGAKLPWENPDIAPQLGCFYRPLLRLLRRDPRKRLTVSQFYDNVNAELAASTHVVRRSGGDDGASDGVTGGGSSGGHSGDSSEHAQSSTATRSKRMRLKKFMQGLARASATG
eukprot:jgi/Ulvmu1/8634/UM046_0037.1